MKRLLKNSISLLASFVIALSLFTPSVKAEAYSRAAVLLSEYSIDTDVLIPGEKSTINFTVTNPTGTLDVTNVFITVNFGDYLAYPVYGTSNQFYISSLAAGESAEFSMEVETVDSITADVVRCNLYITFSDENAPQIDSNPSIFLPVSSDSRINVGSISVPPTAQVNVKTRISASYYNAGKSDIEDVVLHVDNINGQNETYALGSIRGGESNFAEYYVTFAETGDKDISVYLSYQNASGEEIKTEATEYKVSVTEAEKKVVEKVENDAETPASTFTNLSNMTIIGLLVLVIIILGLKYIIDSKKTRK